VQVDGCATFWKHGKFVLQDEYSIEFNDIARQEVARLGLDDGEARRFMNRLSKDNVAQVVVLEAVQSPRMMMLQQQQQPRANVCIANTHLYSNVQRADVKLWQACNLLRELRQFVATRDLPLVLCGDFNSEPESAVYEYILSGMISSERPELAASTNTNSGGNSHDHTVKILPSLHHISHDLDLASAMGSVLGAEPLFTNYTAKFKGTLDYVYYTPSRIRVLGAAALPEEHDIVALSGEGLPSACYPSDHVMLCVDMALAVSGNGSILNEMGVNSGAVGSRTGIVPSMMRVHGSSNSISSMGSSSTAGGLASAHNSSSKLSALGGVGVGGGVGSNHGSSSALSSLAGYGGGGGGGVGGPISSMRATGAGVANRK
jgi:endonuclease/exonuclease/phosphatase family metal-dependent hydrolase